MLDFQSNKEALYQKLVTLGWTPSDDPEVRAMSEMFMEQNYEDLSRIVRDSYYAFSVDPQWVDEESTWEKPMGRLSRDLRQTFVTAMVQKGCTPEFIADSKKRWHLAEFSSVSRHFLTIGDVSVAKPVSCPLPLKDEIDIAGENVEQGRQSITFDRWQTISSKVTACRLKINGERFVVKDLELRGFKTILLEQQTTYQVLEYYAGTYYSIFPIVKEMGKIFTKEGILMVHPHPFVSPQSISASSLESHKFDGVMLTVGSDEFRAKWYPTAEMDYQGSVWEHAWTTNGLYPMRDRPGKLPMKLTTVQAILPAEISGRSLLPLLKFPSVREDPVSVNIVKVVFFTPQGFVFFLERGKKMWDFIGGRVEPGESHIEALTREILEETGFRVPKSEFVHLVDHVEGIGKTYCTSIYAAVLPSSMQGMSNLRVISNMSFQQMVNSDLCRPRKVWISNMLMTLSRLGTLAECMSLLCVAGHALLPPPYVISSVPLRKKVMPLYASYLSRLFLQRVMEVQRCQGVKILPTKSALEKYYKRFFFGEVKIFLEIFDCYYSVQKALIEGNDQSATGAMFNCETVEKLSELTHLSMAASASIFAWMGSIKDLKSRAITEGGPGYLVHEVKDLVAQYHKVKIKQETEDEELFSS